MCLVNSVLHVPCVLFAGFFLFLSALSAMSLSIVHFGYDFNNKNKFKNT